jgi:hypothetical protein
MFQAQPCSTPAQRRRAIILLVVLALLTLFAIVGLTFVMYADSEATSSRIFREANYRNAQNTGPTVDVNLLASWALGQLVFDVDDSTGLYSALRGHSVGRDMYGYNYTWNPGANPPNPPMSMPPPGPPYSPGIANIFPFNGTGKLHVPSVLGLPDDAMVPNYTYFSADGFVRDPERYGTRPVPVGTNPNTVAPQLYTGGWNSSYTYPDHNHMFLGAAKADGTLLTQSFYRSWTGFGSLDPTNPNWFDPTNPALKYMVLRPRPADHLLAGETWPPARPFFPPPADAHGDVANITRPDGLSDSVWMDLDFPVQYTSTGQKYKPLFAFFIRDLDSCVNLNAHGNIRGLTNTGQPMHVSNQGLGKWDVNLSQVLTLNPVAGSFEYTNLFLGNGSPTSPKPRYGPDKQPSSSGTVGQPGNLSHNYAQIDVDSCNELNGFVPTGPIQLPNALPNAFPTFPQGYENGYTVERTNHPLIFNLVQPGGDDNVFGVQNMKLLLYSGQTGSQALSSEPGQLCPTNFNPLTNPRISNLVTTDSWDVDRPAVTAWLWDRTAQPYQVNNAPAGSDQMAPTGPLVSFPDPAANRNIVVPASSEFGIPGKGESGVPPTPVDWRAYNDPITYNSTTISGLARVTQYLSRVDLNRFLTPYPHMGSSQVAGQAVSPLNYISNQASGFSGRFDSDQAASGPIYTQFLAAQNDRQQLADDIYRRLLRVAGVQPVAAANIPKPLDSDLMPRRWLAQLAVNIVDFIDEDDISTPFQFYTAATDGLTDNQFAVNPAATNPPANAEVFRYWVFGTELPRIVVNEVLTEYTLPVDAMGNPMAGPVPVNFWVELYNPLPTTAASATNPLQPLDTQPVPLYVGPAGSANQAFSPFQILIGDQLWPIPAVPGTNDNIMGTINSLRTQTGKTEFPANVPSVDGKTNPASSIAPQTFFLVGPKADDVGKTISPSNSPTLTVPGTTPLYQSPNMSYTLQYDPAGPTFKFTDAMGNTNTVTDTTVPIAPPNAVGVTVLLRRLANPYMPPDPNLNPYITIDFLNQIPLNAVKDNTVVHNSKGRRQPYASNVSQIFNQSGDPTVNTKHSLGKQNTAGATPPDLTSYDWLVHLDRQLLSPMELLNVSGYHPHQLTHRFRINVAAPDYGHLVDWWDQTTPPGPLGQSNRLYRIFEFLEAHDRASGMNVGGRLAGKININTMWDPETFNALCDAQSSNYFTQADVTLAYQSMVGLRTPNLGGAPPGISANDLPFLSLAIGSSKGDALNPSGYGINNTFLRAATAGGTPATPRLFQAQSQSAVGVHPYIQNELMTKIFNNVTTRSNVFAVWFTVGFFNVVQDTDAMGNPVRPVKLGAEMGAQYRHRFFAIVDRTNLNILAMTSPTEYLNSSTPVVGTPQFAGGPSFPVTQTITLSGLTGSTPNGMTWSVHPGMALVVDTGSNKSYQYLTPGQQANQETVIVQSVNTATNQITATFMKAHGTPPPAKPTTYTIMIPGNPGPQPNVGWNVTSPYQPVLPYVTIIN